MQEKSLFRVSYLVIHTLMNLGNELPSNFALKAFLSSISSIFRYSLRLYLTYIYQKSLLLFVVCVSFVHTWLVVCNFVCVINNAIKPLLVLTPSPIIFVYIIFVM